MATDLTAVELATEDKRCHATSKQSGNRCKNVGIHRTPKGKWVCRFHGANAGRPPKHGRDSIVYVPEKIQEAFQHFLDDPNITDLSSEIARLRTELASVDTEFKGDLSGAKAVVSIIETIGKLVEKMHKIEHGDRYVITIPQLEVFVARVTAAIADNCPESCPHRDAVADSIEEVTGGA